MDAFDPTVVDLLLKSVAGEFQPGLVEVGAALVLATDPDQRGHAIGHRPEAIFALTQDVRGLFQLDICARQVLRRNPQVIFGARDRVERFLGSSAHIPGEPDGQQTDALVPVNHERGNTKIVG